MYFKKIIWIKLQVYTNKWPYVVIVAKRWTKQKNIRNIWNLLSFNFKIILRKYKKSLDY